MEYLTVHHFCYVFGNIRFSILEAGKILNLAKPSQEAWRQTAGYTETVTKKTSPDEPRSIEKSGLIWAYLGSSGRIWEFLLGGVLHHGDRPR